jgi:hypothetical protein
MSDEIAPLEAIQSFEPASVARTEALGSTLDFTDAVPTVKSVVDFYRLFPRELVSLLPDTQVQQIQSYSNACWTTIQQMLRFNPSDVANPANERTGLITQLKAQFSDSISTLGPSVAFISAMRRNLSGFESEARDLVDAAKERAREIDQLREQTAKQVEGVLAEVRSVAAEVGVSQQAGYFGDQAIKHADAAAKWQGYTNWTAAALGLFAIATLVGGYWIRPADTYQALQFGLSKLLIFSTIAFMLYLCARTLMAHRHNEVVNRHRQNALLTFNALADAATKPEARDVVLTQASACIYAPQDSGFSKSTGSQPSGSLVEIVPKIMGAEHLGG